MSGTTNDAVVVLRDNVTREQRHVFYQIRDMYNRTWFGLQDEGSHRTEIINKWNRGEQRWPLVTYEDLKSGSLMMVTTSRHADKVRFILGEDGGLCM